MWLHNEFVIIIIFVQRLCYYVTVVLQASINPKLVVMQK